MKKLIAFLLLRVCQIIIVCCWGSASAHLKKERLLNNNDKHFGGLKCGRSNLLYKLIKQPLHTIVIAIKTKLLNIDTLNHVFVVEREIILELSCLCFK